DTVFAFGSPEVFDTTAQYGLDGAFVGEVTYCGYLCSEEAHTANAHMRAAPRIANNKLVVVAAGGGYDAYPMMSACLKAFQLFGKDLLFEAVVITGPLMEHGQRESLRRQAQGLPVRVLRYVNEQAGLAPVSEATLAARPACSCAEVRERLGLYERCRSG